VTSKILCAFTRLHWVGRTPNYQDKRLKRVEQNHLIIIQFNPILTAGHFVWSAFDSMIQRLRMNSTLPPPTRFVLPSPPVFKKVGASQRLPHMRILPFGICARCHASASLQFITPTCRCQVTHAFLGWECEVGFQVVGIPLCGLSREHCRRGDLGSL